MAAFGSVWAWFFFPELKGRSLEEVDEMFEAGIWAYQFKKYVTTSKASQIARIEEGDTVHKLANDEDDEHLEVEPEAKV